MNVSSGTGSPRFVPVVRVCVQQKQGINKTQNWKPQELTLSFHDLVINSSESGGIFLNASRQAANLCEPETNQRAVAGHVHSTLQILLHIVINAKHGFSDFQAQISDTQACALSMPVGT